MSKTCKLWVHKRTPNQKDLMITSKDFPNLKIGDVLEIYHPEDEFSRLLLQVESLLEDLQQKQDTISIADSIATIFQLRGLKDVIVNKIEPQNVALDMVELLFKEQYLHRSDMWRLMNTLKNTCVYLNKKVEFAEIRCMVSEMWSKGEKVTCGVITEDTRVVFRSSTAVVQIFIQMSSEMWEFDLNGDLYFEKAVNGFLTDLFAKWKDQNCCHDVTIVLFSRTIYQSQSLEDFPPDIRECLQVDDFGNIYEDFYRVIVQNERYEEWNHTLRLLRKLFKQYPEYVLRYHQQQWPSWKIPAARNSTSAQGNFLETLNMSLNLFEKYYLDRNFDRTGKVSVVITPGPGVFEVDRELTFITKQRTIDCGVGSDLVCMGEQPLHAVPLFKFRSKNAQISIEVGDDYNIPHWMNHSFYTSKNQIQNQQNAAFVPRIKPPPEFMKMMEKNPPKMIDMVSSQLKAVGDDDNFPFVDYDEYDSQVFKMPSRTSHKSLRSASCYGLKGGAKRIPQTFAEARRMCRPRTRHISDEVVALNIDSSDKKSRMSSSAISIPATSNFDDISNSVGCYPILEKTLSRESFESSGSEELQYQRPVVGSAGSPIGHSHAVSGFHPNRALINPFAPSRLQFRMTSNRRRWVHALPTDAKGVTVQPHHVQTSASSVSQEAEEYTFSTPTPEVVKAAQLAVEARRHKSFSVVPSIDGDGPPDTEGASPGIKSVSSSSSKQLSYGNITPAFQRSVSNAQRLFSNMKEKYIPWAPTGEQEWTPDLTTGWDWRPLDQNEASSTESRLVKPIFSPVFESDDFCPGISVDWKSLTVPAALPITTDYFPEGKSLENDYVMAADSLLPDDINSEFYTRPGDGKNLAFYRRVPLTTKEVFRELISQRLGQGFQWIVQHSLQKTESAVVTSTPISQNQHAKGRVGGRHADEPQEMYKLSIGRIFHTISRSHEKIDVIRYKPRHPQPQRKVTYRYRFQAPDSYCYDASWTEFSNELLENYNWNYLDHYICTRGEGDYGLIDSLKYWRSRFFLLPNSNAATRKIIEAVGKGDQSIRCDIYEEKSPADFKQLVSGFLRFVEILNKLKRSPQARRSKVAGEVDTSPGKLDQDSKDKEEKLTAAAPLVKIADAMLDTQNGLSFIQSQPGLPGNCFISAEAVMWVQQHVVGAQTLAQAKKILEGLVEEKLILHASGNEKHKFIFGFYLYYFSYPKAKSEPHVTDPGSDYNTLFQNEWLEVSILPSTFLDEGSGEQTGGKFFLPRSTESPERTVGIPPSPFSPITVREDWRNQTGWCKQGWGQQSGKINVCTKNATLHHKYVNVDVNANKKSEREEWATACYNAYYSPLCVFEMQIQWMVSTGCLLGDTIYSWARKASTFGFHLIPVPVDPFALPNCVNSDPLRGPSFIPLSLSLEEGLFIECAEDAKQERLLVIQDAILKRFGFVPCNVRQPDDTVFPAIPHSRQEVEDYKHQYVHCTVGMFVLIPELKPSPPAPAPIPKPPAVVLRHPPSPTTSYLAKRSSSDLRKDYIARQQSNLKSEHNHRVGFLWSWNFMSSKRWRSGNTGYEDFQDKMLADFRHFCSNKDRRLEEFLQDFSFTLS